MIFCFWSLYNFFAQELPLYYDEILLMSITFGDIFLVKNTTICEAFLCSVTRGGDIKCIHTSCGGRIYDTGPYGSSRID